MISNSTFPSFPARGSIAGVNGTRRSSNGNSRAGTPSNYAKSKTERHQDQVKNVESEYIRNLQQQIYLLELETRYLKQGAAAKKPETHVAESREVPDAIRATSQPLEGTFNALKYKYVELQERNKEEIQKLHDKNTDLEKENQLLRMKIAEAEKEKNDLRVEMRASQEQISSAQEKAVTESLTLQKRLEVAQTEVARLELSYNRVLGEKEKLQATTTQSVLEASKYKDQVEEQLAINANLTKKVDELQRANRDLQIKLEDQQSMIMSFDVETYKGRIKELMQEKINLQTEIKQLESLRGQQEQLHKRLNEDFNELMKNNVSMSNELEDLRKRYKAEVDRNDEKLKRRQEDLKLNDSVKDEVSTLRDAAQMAKIALEAKDRKINELTATLQTQDLQLHKAMETKAVLEDKTITLEDRLKKQEAEIIALSQDKSALATELGQVKQSYDVKTRKYSMLSEQNSNLKVELERYERELLARQEFGQLLSQIEQSGENYLTLMKNVKGFLGNTTGLRTQQDHQSDGQNQSLGQERVSKSRLSVRNDDIDL